MTTHTETQHMTLPKLHRIQGDFTLMDYDKKEFFTVSHSVLDELCHRSNSFPALLAALEQLTDYAEAARDVLKQTEHKRLLDDTCAPIVAARAAIAAAKAP